MRHPSLVGCLASRTAFSATLMEVSQVATPWLASGREKGHSTGELGCLRYIRPNGPETLAYYGRGSERKVNRLDNIAR